MSDVDWESAYERFETPEEEIRKFVRRHRALGVDSWGRDLRVVELFCGRGGGLHALAELGFTHVEGVDLSPALLARYAGPARVHLADCRALPFEDASRDAVVVQGGLHHLEDHAGLERVLEEARRVLVPSGRLVLVEPWMTPFLRFVHAVTEIPLMQRLSPKLEAFEAMRRGERVTYERWLGDPQRILGAIRARFEPEVSRIAWGKLLFVGSRRA